MSQSSPLPVTVISGYLGAGKTSLINHLLRNAGGRRIMVLVNDFGDIDIDADLLESADEDTLTLSNGCICCTMGTELLYALSDALDRRPRPDCLVIEASGVAQPAKIAAAAHAEPEMRYCGIVTLADAANIAGRLEDALIGPQVADQLRAADLVLVTKTDLAPFEDAKAAVAALSPAPVIAAPRGEAPVDLILERPEALLSHGGLAAAHDEIYVGWSAEGGTVPVDRLKAFLAAPPPGLYRLKGWVRTGESETVEAQLVGRTWEIVKTPPRETRVVAIGVRPTFDPQKFEASWRALAKRP